MLETRPYMRARASLASLLAESGKLDQAIGHLEALLELNPNDNQGNRYVLIGHYLAIDRIEAAGRLLDQFEDEASAMFCWARVLQQYLSGNSEGALAALAEARKSNRHAEAYLSGRKRLPSQLPDHYGIGDENEAIVCTMEIGVAWAKHPKAIGWLLQQR